MTFQNPFRPGAGHMPPYLAGRIAEQEEFRRVLGQNVITQNLILTGLRGVGKTVLLETFRPIAVDSGWLWAGTDLSESASVSEDRLATRILADVALIASPLLGRASKQTAAGFTSEEQSHWTPLSYDELTALFNKTPGLVSDKLKAALEFVWAALAATGVRGIVFAYDEAQNLADHAVRNEFPLSLLLEVFQSLQRKGIPFVLVLTGLPTLSTKLVEARTYSERMFHVVFLKQLDSDATKDAIVTPTLRQDCPLKFSPTTVERIASLSGGYPYFIQFISKEVYDVWISKITVGEVASVPHGDIIRKLDTDFFQARWTKATDRQRELLQVIATLENCDREFTVQEVVACGRESLAKGFSSSHVNQMLASLANGGLVYKNRYGKYSLAVPLLSQFILRTAGEAVKRPLPRH